MPCCGSIDPGTLPRASRNSRTSAIRIEVSCRQAHFSQSASPNVPPPGDAGPGRGWSSGSAAGSNGSVSGARTSVIGSAPAFPVTFARIAVSSGYVAVPKTAPAMCPVRSITSVVGVPAIGTTAVKSSVITELGSLTLG